MNISELSNFYNNIGKDLKNELESLHKKVIRARDEENWGTYKNIILAYKEVFGMYQNILNEFKEDKPQEINLNGSLKWFSDGSFNIKGDDVKITKDTYTKQGEHFSFLCLLDEGVPFKTDLYIPDNTVYMDEIIIKINNSGNGKNFIQINNEPEISIESSSANITKYFRNGFNSITIHSNKRTKIDFDIYMEVIVKE